METLLNNNMMLIIIATIMLLLAVNPVMSQTQFIYGLCSTKKYAPNTPYAANVNAVINKLVSNNKLVPGFSKYTQGGLNGVLQCRGDATRAHCLQCAGAAAASIRSRCKNAVGARVQHEHCFLRYENFAFADKPDVKVVKSLINVKKSTGIIGFNPKLQSVLASVGRSAPTRPEKFAASKVSVKPGVTIYAMETCLRSLSPPECATCLDVAVKTLNSCCSTHVGAQVHLSSCNVRFEMYNFLDTAVAV